MHKISKYKLITLGQFDRDYKKFKKSKDILSKINKSLKFLLEHPYHLSLKTHKVNIPLLGYVCSSRVTGDLRFIWILDQEDRLLIIAIRLQGHDTVYD